MFSDILFSLWLSKVGYAIAWGLGTPALLTLITLGIITLFMWDEWQPETFKKVKTIMLVCSILLILMLVGGSLIPSKEMIVLFHLAPELDAYVAANPETLFSVQGVAGFSEDMARGILDIIESIISRVSN